MEISPFLVATATGAYSALAGGCVYGAAEFTLRLMNGTLCRSRISPVARAFKGGSCGVVTGVTCTIPCPLLGGTRADCPHGHGFCDQDGILTAGSVTTHLHHALRIRAR
jgi:hypothetical protein